MTFRSSSLPRMPFGRPASSVPTALRGRAEPVGSASHSWRVDMPLGPVNAETGRPVALPHMPGWADYPVRDRLAARYDVPVWVDNEVNLMALGEFRGGLGRGGV